MAVISDQEEKDEAKEIRQPVKTSAPRKRKRHRRLNDLDSESTLDEEESEDEFQISDRWGSSPPYHTASAWKDWKHDIYTEQMKFQPWPFCPISSVPLLEHSMEEDDFVVSGDDGGSDADDASWDRSERGSISSSVDRLPPTRRKARNGRAPRIKRSSRRPVQRHPASSEEEEEEMGL